MQWVKSNQGKWIEKKLSLPKQVVEQRNLIKQMKQLNIPKDLKKLKNLITKYEKLNLKNNTQKIACIAKGKGLIKTTQQNCKVRGGQLIKSH